jgi:hypothetical protein
MVGVDHGARGSRVQQEMEGTSAVHHGLNDHQVSVAQLEFDDLA